MAYFRCPGPSGSAPSSNQTYKVLDLITNSVPDHFIHPGTGELEYEATDLASDFIEVDSGDVLAFINWFSGWSGWTYNAFYDENKEFISALDIRPYHDSTHHVPKCVVPEGAKYVRFSCEGPALPQQIIALLENYPEDT